jgi:serine protease Do
MIRHPSICRWLARLSFLIACGATPLIAAEPLVDRQHLVSVFNGAAPASVNDLRAMQDHVRLVTERVLPATVAVVAGSAQGSGVIISSDGYVLTAAHVIGGSERNARIYLHDGRRVSAQKLGTNRTLDAGLLKIDEKALNGEAWPHVKVGDSSKVQSGQWCLAMGHPGGVQAAREPALRLGRILNLDLPSAVTTDCTLIGGDSGGPLFNMKAEVIGIHSRIGGALTANLHVPVNTYTEHWDRLVKGDSWGHIPGQEPFLGVQGDSDRNDAVITRVFERSPAEKGGVRVGDLIVRFAGQSISDFDSLKSMVQDQDPGSVVDVEVMRDGKRLQLQVTIGRIRD